MDSFLNPNVAYVLLVVGFMLAVLALFSPGTGLLELGAVFTLVVAGYIISSLAFNWWALLFFIVAFVGLYFAARSKERRTIWILLVVTFTLLLAGSTLLFSFVDNLPAVNPLLSLSLSLIVVAMTWWMARKSMEAFGSRKSFDPDRIIGMVGRANDDIQKQGSVYVNGENWTATSQAFIPSGSEVRVTRREGLMIEVEPVASAVRRKSTNQNDTNKDQLPG